MKKSTQVQLEGMHCVNEDQARSYDDKLRKKSRVISEQTASHETNMVWVFERGWRGGCSAGVVGAAIFVKKGDDYRSVSFSILLPPSPPFVLLTSLRSARANTHALNLFFSQIHFVTYQ
eukprot:SAG25_NODE_673_length_6002_cov_4.287481_5_plen_119_part_00